VSIAQLAANQVIERVPGSVTADSWAKSATAMNGITPRRNVGRGA
jgi:hypothetical protein